MTHRLLLIRHAKSSWDDPMLADRDRPLAKRGRKAAERIGAHLRHTELRPDLVLCSSARRTRETFDRMRLDSDVVVEDGLYGADGEELLARLRSVPEGVETAALVGHNPGMHDLAIDLTGNATGADARRLRERFPTAAVAVFEIDGEWRGLAPGAARLTSFVVPRELA